MRIVRPVPLITSRLPVTASGPLGAGATMTSPSRAASAVTSPVAGSPVATKPASLCEPSQYGLFFDAPQRQSVARVPIGLPETVRAPRKASGPFSRTWIRFTGGGASLGPPSLRRYCIAPDGQFSAVATRPAALVASSGAIQGPTTLALNTPGCCKTQNRAWMQRLPSNEMAMSRPSATSIAEFSSVGLEAWLSLIEISAGCGSRRRTLDARGPTQHVSAPILNFR